MDGYVRASEQGGMVRYLSDHARRSDDSSFGEGELACAAAGGCVGAVGCDDCAACVCVYVCVCVCVRAWIAEPERLYCIDFGSVSRS